MFCPHCGQNNPPDSLFCTYCGACLNYDDNNSFQPTPPMNPYTCLLYTSDAADD